MSLYSKRSRAGVRCDRSPPSNKPLQLTAAGFRHAVAPQLEKSLCLRRSCLQPTSRMRKRSHSSPRQSASFRAIGSAARSTTFSWRYRRSRGAGNGRSKSSPRFRSARSPARTHPTESWILQSFSQSLCDEKGVGGLLQARDLAVSHCPEMGESGLHPPPLLRNAEIASENDHVIARLEVLIPFRV